MEIKLNKLNQDQSKEGLVKILTQHEVFSGFNSNDKEQLSAIVSFKSVNKKDVIFEIDDPPNHIFYLLEGSLTLNFPDKSKLNILPDELIGEIGILNGDFHLEMRNLIIV